MAKRKQELSELDNYIVRVQKSTRTLFSFMQKPHEKMRMKYAWYYRWHIKPHATVIHYAGLSIYLLLIGSLIFNVFSNIVPVRAATYTATWSSYNDFTNNQSTVQSATTQTNVKLTGSGNANDANSGSVTNQPTEFTESFDTTDYRDSGNSSALWDTGAGTLTNSTGFSVMRHGGNLKAMWFTSATTGFVGGGLGIIYRTTDSGTTWLPVTTGVGFAINAMHFPSATVGYAVGANAKILKTTDGGQTWTTKTQAIVSTLNSVYFVSDSVGYAVGDSTGAIKTTDGGDNWSAITIGLAGNLRSLYFTSATAGYTASSDGKVYRTTDGGDSWSGVATGGFATYDTVFTSSSVGFAAGYTGQGVVYKTTNSGGSWSSKLAADGTIFSGLYFTGASVGYAVGSAGKVYKTTDGGDNWSDISANFNNATDLSEVFFTDANTGYISGASGLTAMTTNAGTSWTIGVKRSEDCSAIDVVSTSLTYVACGRHTMKTTDGGVTWSATVNASSTTINAITFTSDTVGYLAGSSGTIYKTIDGGENWVAQASGTENSLYDIQFLSEATGVAVGANNTILRTINGGTNWTAIDTSACIGGSCDLRSVHFPSALVGYAPSYGTAQVLKTTDGGQTWSLLSNGLGSGNNHADVYFTSDMVGYIAGRNGQVYRTTDGGASWGNVYIGALNQLTGISFVSSTDGYAVGNLGVYKTTNSGTNWSLATATSISATVKIDFTSPTNGMTVGAANTIFKTCYLPSQGQSATVYSGGTVASARLTASQTLNGQTATYYLSADGGSHWEAATSGTLHTFSATGSDLRWRVLLSTNAAGDTAPVVDSITIAYAFPNGAITNLKIDAGGEAAWSKIAWSATASGSSVVKFQTRSAATEGGLASASWGTEISESNVAGNIINAGTPSNQWLEIKVILVSDGNVDPILDDFTVTYAINATPTITINSASQGSNGLVTISATLGDIDNDTGTTQIFYHNGLSLLSNTITYNNPATAGALALSDASRLPNSGTVVIDGEQITYSGKSTNNLTGITRGANGTVAAGHNQNTRVFAASSATVGTGLLSTGASGSLHTFTWNPNTDLPNVYDTDIRIKVFVNDGEAARNIGVSDSADIIVDTKVPMVGAVPIIINGGAAKTNNAALNLDFDAADDSPLEVSIATTEGGVGSGWQAYADPTTYTVSDTDEAKTVYVRFRDTKGNELDTTYNDSIELDTFSPVPDSVKVVDGTKDEVSQLVVTWTSLSNADFTTYSIERSTNGTDYSAIKNYSDKTVNSYADRDVLMGQTYYYRVRSVDDLGNLSDYSAPVSITKGDSTDTTSPTITTGPAVTVTSTSATVTWSTNENADSNVEYGLTTDYGTVIGKVDSGTGHSVTVNGLESGKTYHYRVRTRDGVGNITISPDGQFATTTLVPPVISEVVVTPSLNSVAVSWKTDLPTNSEVKYGKTALYGQAALSSNLTTVHSMIVTGLDIQSTYHLQIESAAESGAEAVSPDQEFTTSVMPSSGDSTLSIVQVGEDISASTNGRAIILWETSKAATSQVLYGITSSLGQQSSASATLTIEHFEALQNLLPDTTYYYKVQSKDANGIMAESAIRSFNIPANPTSAPAAISSVSVTDITLNSAIITWKTGSVTTSTINLGTTGSYGQTVGDESTGSTTIHTVRLDSLSQGTEYHFRITGEDSGNQSIASDDYVFSTLTMPVISNIVVKDINSNGATITWSTNTETDSFVDFGKDTARLNQSQGRSETVKDHAVTLIGLSPATVYHFQVKSRDIYTNQTVSDAGSFTTTVDVTPPEIKDLKSETSVVTDANGESKAQAIISWSTDEPSTSQVQYSMGVAANDSYQNSTAEDRSLATSHIAVISNLIPSATYHLRAIAKDAAGNIAVSDDYTVLTLKQETTLLQYIVQVLEDKFFWVKELGVFGQ